MTKLANTTTKFVKTSLQNINNRQYSKNVNYKATFFYKNIVNKNIETQSC